jgi:isocitrate lyase
MAATLESGIRREAALLERSWAEDARWRGIERDHSAEDVVRLRGSLRIEHTLARVGAERLFRLLHDEHHVPALGALTGGQAVQMVRAGLQAIYLSGWQVAADANLGEQVYPDQSLYPANSVPAVVRRINAALRRADQIAVSEGDHSLDWYAPIVADAEAGFGGALNAYELMRGMVEAGAAGVHFEDQLAAEKKVRAPGRQGAGPDRPVRQDAGCGAPGGRRVRRAYRALRAHRRALGHAAHLGRRRARRRLPHG